MMLNESVVVAGAIQSITIELGSTPVGNGEGWQVFVGQPASTRKLAKRALLSNAVWHRQVLDVTEWRKVTVDVSIVGSQQRGLVQPALAVSQGDYIGIWNPSGSMGIAIGEFFY
jgi:hypothetical protein